MYTPIYFSYCTWPSFSQNVISSMSSSVGGNDYLPQISSNSFSIRAKRNTNANVGTGQTSGQRDIVAHRLRNHKNSQHLIHQFLSSVTALFLPRDAMHKRGIAYAVTRCLSVCLSVCPSRSWITSKRIKI